MNIDKLLENAKAIKLGDDDVLMVVLKDDDISSTQLSQIQSNVSDLLASRGFAHRTIVVCLPAGSDLDVTTLRELKKRIDEEVAAREAEAARP